MDQHLLRLKIDPSQFDDLSEYPKLTKETDADRMIRFLCTVGQLKTIDRTGWILKGREIKKPETIAGHMYRMGIIGLLLDDENDSDASKTGKLDISKVVTLSLIHDMSECIVGDITPFDGLTEDEKHHKELIAMKHLVSLLPSFSSKKLLNLYHEYESRETEESKVVKELDRFEVMLQAFQYERSEWTNFKRLVRFDEFFTIALANVHHHKLRPMLLNIVAERERFWAEMTSNKDSHSNGVMGDSSNVNNLSNDVSHS